MAARRQCVTKVRTQSTEMTLRSSERTVLCQPFARTDSFLHSFIPDAQLFSILVKGSSISNTRVHLTITGKTAL